MSLKLQNISKHFEDNGMSVLEDVNLEIESGEFISLLGPSGCGKSTILNIIAGLVKQDKGDVILDGELVTKPGAERIMMFQESALFPWLNVWDNVNFGMDIAKIAKEEREFRAEKYLKMVQLYKFKDYNIHQLSGGMKQRVALARALCLDSKILLMDEPFAALDKQTINLLREEVLNIWNQTKKTIILVTHSVEEALFFSDRIVMVGSRPSKIKKVIDVNIERPRHIESKEFVNIRKELMMILKEEVNKVAKEEHDD